MTLANPHRITVASPYLHALMQPGTAASNQAGHAPRCPQDADDQNMSAMTLTSWRAVDVGLSCIIGRRGADALYQRSRHLTGEATASSAALLTNFHGLTTQLLGAPLTERLLHPVLDLTARGPVASTSAHAFATLSEAPQDDTAPSAIRTLMRLNAQAHALRAELRTLQRRLTELRREVDDDRSAQLVQANEQLVLAAFDAQIAAETATCQLPAAAYWRAPAGPMHRPIAQALSSCWTSNKRIQKPVNRPDLCCVRRRDRPLVRRPGATAFACTASRNLTLPSPSPAV
jgi:hypothetical protein